MTGVYYITNRGSDSFPVLCDQSADGGGEKLFPVCLCVCVKFQCTYGQTCADKLHEKL